MPPKLWNSKQSNEPTGQTLCSATVSPQKSQKNLPRKAGRKTGKLGSVDEVDDDEIESDEEIYQNRLIVKIPETVHHFRTGTWNPKSAHSPQMQCI